MASVVDRVKLIQPESMRLKQYLRALPREASYQPSACAQWQVQDVVAHLVGAAEAYMRLISRGVQGDASPPEGLPPAGTLNADLAAEGIAQRAMIKRETLGEHLLAAFEATGDALNCLLAELDLQDWEKPCYQSIGQIPVRCFIDLRLQELVIHGWDIRCRFVPDALLSPESLPSLMDMLALLTPRWAFWPGEKLSSPIRYHFDVTGAVPIMIDLIVEGDTARMAERSDRLPDVTVRCDTETYVLMRYGRISLAAPLATGRAAVAGDQASAMAFGRWFKGI